MTETAVAAPIVRTVRRYVCPFCQRGRSSRAATVEHIADCWKNPAVRSCGSCRHFRVCCGEASAECGCYGEPYCDAGATITADDGEHRVVRQCPAWSAR